MNNGQVCVGGLTTAGRYVRLLDINGNNQPQDTDLMPLQTWEIDYVVRANCIPPHVEDVLIRSRTRKGSLKKEETIQEFIEKRDVPIWKGSPDILFDGLLKWTSNGSGYIDEEGGIPSHSVGFWVNDKPLTRKDYEGVRYQYPSTFGWRSIKYKGLEEPVNIIPAGTLIRISLARWKSFKENETPKCWLQLSGWYDLKKTDREEHCL
ncbi:hypothetical protein IX307_000883 [Bacteroides pyogenes]|nr:hypothetical protein [Bacteroides pyogenes]MBR8719584.1 hypothetical protein [Bacteroides pyogenes]MBR8786574.1 hypothetical protein [Bacteroides pyogenes]MBR8792057.1 hypothetical protein [Bacteroides pyogenes]